jgi:hypothetical protein
MRIGANTKLGLITTVKLGFKVPSLSLVSVRMETLPNSNQSKANPMTKSEEIQILTAAADSLGSDSYCGAWLREQIPFIESDIRSDFAPGVLTSASIQDCAAKCLSMRAEAVAESKRILADARKEADQIRAQAVRFNELQREELKRTLNAILSRID